MNAAPSGGYANQPRRTPARRKDTVMSVTTTEELPAGSAIADDDPFGLDITFIENTLPAQQPLLCATDDTCGSSCPSACTTS